MNICILLHASFEGSSYIGQWASARGHRVKEIHCYRDQLIPAPSEYDWLILMGGPMDPSQVDRYPFLEAEMETIRQARQQGKKILGVCLGAQLVGAALGAPVERSPEREIGFFPVEKSEEGRDDPYFSALPDPFLALHWHGMMPGLPEGAQVLAKSEGCPRQICRFGDEIYGLQFHLEMTRSAAERLIKHAGEDLTPGRFVQTSQQILSGPYEALNRQMNHILDQLSEVAACNAQK
jgi:GMP synthase (glutamine-hydrolysing)